MSSKIFELVIGRFRKNYAGFWQSYKWLVGVFILALLCDGASTMYFMLKKGDSTEEVHPVILLVSIISGPVLGPLLGVIGKAAAGIFVAIYCRRYAVYILLVGIVLSFWAAWYNVWGINLYVPRVIKWICW